MNQQDSRPRAIFLMGPTATGKTALACELASRYPLDLISVDSALVYRGMNIGTAKPDAEMLEKYPHRLVDIRDPLQSYSAAEFRDDALIELGRISADGRIPLLVGGTGLYFRAIERGLSPLPQADRELRLQLASEATTCGKEHMHSRLAELDPESALRLNVNDSQRVQRALEVTILSGRPMSELQGAARARLPYHVLKLVLMPSDRAPLHARIAERFDVMLDLGLIDELKTLRNLKGWSDELPSMRAVGYRQGWPFLDGRCSAEEFRMAAIHATRQLAKRQITWLRSELDALRFDPEAQSTKVGAESAVRAFLEGC